MKTIAELYRAISDIDNRIREYKESEDYKSLNTYQKNELTFIGYILKEAGYNINKNGHAEKNKSGADVKPEEVLNYFKTSDFKKLEFYHYTDLSGLLGIFKSYIDSDSNSGRVERCTMRACHLRFLNDSQEYVEGQNCYNKYIKDFEEDIIEYRALKGYLNDDNKPSEVSEKLKEYKQELRENFVKAVSATTEDYKGDENIYSISFCGEGDLLSQWKYYGKNSGIAIKFNFKNAKCFIEKDCLSETGSETTEYAVCPLKIAYTDVEKLVLFAMSCLQPSNNGATMVAGGPNPDILIPFCKNEAFKEELESRMVFAPDKAKCKYVVSDGRVKPYISITFLAEKDANIIESITVGPGENQNLVYNALLHIFDSKTFRFQEDNGEQSTSTDNKSHECSNGVKIKKSCVPFRG